VRGLKRRRIQSSNRRIDNLQILTAGVFNINSGCLEARGNCLATVGDCNCNCIQQFQFLTIYIESVRDGRVAFIWYQVALAGL
jgi:hypothetical protein